MQLPIFIMLLENGHLVDGYNNSAPWNFYEYPNPMSSPQACGMDYPSFICDPDGILSSDERVMLAIALRAACEETPCVCSDECTAHCKGYSIAIALLYKMETDGDQYIQSEIQRWAEELQENMWKFGDCDNDIVIVHAPGNEAMYTSTSKSANEVLTDECVNKYHKHFQQYLKNGQYFTALNRTIKNYRSALKDPERCNPEFWGSFWITGALTAFTFLFCLSCCMYCNSCSCWKNEWNQ